MAQDKKLDFLYNTIPGRFLMKILFERRYFSKLSSLYYKSTLSKKKIPSNHRTSYNTFNDYFTRKENREDMSKSARELISPADSFMSVVNIQDNCILNVKGVEYTLEQITKLPTSILGDYKGGIVLIYRLTLDDYHRYYFIDKGSIKDQFFIKGKLHTVRPLYAHNKCYKQNSRHVSIMDSENFGEFINIEVGALLVGKIKNHDIPYFSRMMEKGYFEYGGSTIIQIFKPNSIKINENYLDTLEHHVIAGEVVGMKITNN